MISWEGRFSWQGYAETGRPDFLNYLNAGDVTWEALWEFYRAHPVVGEAIRSLTRLFHLFLSSEFDRAGCWLDPDGEIHTRLRAWAEFTLDSAGRVPLSEIQADLAGLVGAGLVTPLYYQATYTVFSETSVDRLAKDWRSGQRAADCSDPSELLGPDARHLPMYHPGPDRFLDLARDPAWRDHMCAHLANGFRCWNRALATYLPDLDEEEAWTMVGGEA